MAKNSKSKAKKIVLIISFFIIGIFLSVFLCFTYFYNKYNLDVEQLKLVNNGIKVSSTYEQDNTLYNTDRAIIEIEQLPSYIIKAFVDAEDKRFYSHNGYDLKRIAKAFFINFTSKSKSQGASTISQQLIKNALLSNEKTYSRKIKEIILSIKMEKQFTKDEIMEMYLNTIYFGSNAYGIENASKVYFNKSAKDLTLNEACCLAGIIKSPNYYSPKYNYDKAMKRRNVIAGLMLKNGDITNSEYNSVVNLPINLSDSSKLDFSYEEEAIFEACNLLNMTEREIINKQYQIITYKDEKLQNKVAEINNNTINTLNEQYDSTHDGLSVVCDNSGHILAYHTKSNYDLHNMKCQPASILKPIAVYLPCLENNLISPMSQILDEEINYSGFSPKNADNKFYGYISAKFALANSLNIPAVKLLDIVGVKKSNEMLQRLGFNFSSADLNLNLSLGSVSKGVKILDILNAYNTISNLGEQKHLTFIDKILDKNGKIIYESKPYSQTLLNEDDCFLLTEMLKETAKSGTAKRLNSLNIPIASKTGTAFNGKQNTDLFNVSYTTEHTMLSWISNIKSGLDNNIKSSVYPTENVKEICKYLYNSTPPKDFEKPAGVDKCAYDLIELETNHRLVEPNTSKERYIGYDYFKITNKPEKVNIPDLNLSATIDKYGVKLNYTNKTNHPIKIIKICDDQKFEINQSNNELNEVSILDSDVFKYSKIEYYLLDIVTDNTSESVIIYPKDYLINSLNNEIKTNKTRWYV